VGVAIGLGCVGSNPEFEEADAGMGRLDARASDGPPADATPGKDAAAAVDAAIAVDVAIAAPPSALLGYWPLDDSPGSPTARDASGRGRHGTVGGAGAGVAFTSAGRVGGALSFPGGTSPEVGVLIPYDDQIDGLRTFTIAAFVKLASLPPTGGHLSALSRQQGTTNREIFNLSCNAGDLVVFIPGGTSQTTFQARAEDSARTDVWIHAAATYDGRWLRLYINGMRAAESDFPNRLVSSPRTPIYIGTNKNANDSQPFHGLIDEVVLYSEALPAATIGQLAAGMSPLDID
jgi:Concanavalin A-like lectin/glucanases superfamily